MEGTGFGRYRLIEQIGQGGMGEVWRAHDTDTDRIVAVKLLPPHLAKDDTFVQRFRREAHTAARLDSPHVIPIHYYGEIDGRLYVDMRLIKGRDLQKVLADGPLPPGRAVRIIEQVAEALQAAHEIGLVHRDVKPSNILLDKNDFAYLIDFGIAFATEDTRLTKTGSMIGTLHYLAPERLGTGEVDARADIYALACVLYECLTGRPPFRGESAERLMAAHLSAPPPQPSTARPDVPAPLDEVIATGMAKDPGQRYATTVELASAAHDAITTPISRSVRAVPASPTTTPHPPPPTPSTPRRAPQPAAPQPSVPAQPPQPTRYGSQPDTASPPPQAPTQAAPTASGVPTQQAPVSTPSQQSPLAPPAPTVDKPQPQRLTRRTKIILGSVAVVAVVAIAVIAIVIGNKSTSRSGVASPTSTTASPVMSTATTPTGTPSAIVTPTSPPSTTPTIDWVPRLLALVPPDLHCEPQPQFQDVQCNLESPLSYALYELFPDKAALDKEFEYLSGQRTLVPCPGRGQSPQDWHPTANPQQIAGKIQCFQPGGQGTATGVEWTIDSQLVLGHVFATERGSVDEAYQWWAAHYQ